MYLGSVIGNILVSKTSVGGSWPSRDAKQCERGGMVTQLSAKQCHAGSTPVAHSKQCPYGQIGKGGSLKRSVITIGSNPIRGTNYTK